MKKRAIVITLLVFVMHLIIASDFKNKLETVYWLADYYNEIIIKQDRNIMLNNIPRLKEEPFIYHYELEKGYHWYEDPSVNYGILSISYPARDTITVIDIQEHTFVLLKEKQIKENYYEVIVDKTIVNEHLIESLLYFGGDLSKARGKIISKLYFKFDGDYLYIFLDDQQTLLTTYYAYSKEEYVNLKKSIRINQFNSADFTLPRHADGSCDYDGRKAHTTNKTAAISSTPTTNVAPSKTMTVKENLKLRSGEAATTSVLAVMSTGTKVKILTIGKQATIDGITSNWVKVEVLAGAKDRDGKPIAAGTTGWCFGGYLGE